MDRKGEGEGERKRKERGKGRQRTEGMAQWQGTYLGIKNFYISPGNLNEKPKR
jgi:hypothetical protein